MRIILSLTLVTALCVSAVMLSAPPASAPVADAAMRGNKDAVRTLLKQGADVNAAEPDGMTALHWAVHHDDLPTALLLVKAGASAKATNRYEVTPLSLACANGNTEIVELLLKAGADPNMKPAAHLVSRETRSVLASARFTK